MSWQTDAPSSIPQPAIDALAQTLGHASTPTFAKAIAPAVSAARTVVPGSPDSSPFFLLLAGQSNAVGRDHSGDKTNPANTYILNGFIAGTVLVPAVFGTNPLNSGPGGSGTTTDPSQACNNMAVHFANKLRASGLIADTRPIVIILNVVPGQPISQWVGSGTSSSYWLNLLTSLAAVDAVYPGFKINHVIWAQGESDNDASGSANASKAAYLTGFTTLLAQWRGLSQWTASTTVSAQELADFADATQRDRNDAIRTMRKGALDPFVTTVTSAGIGESTDSPFYHFDGVGLVTLGGLHFQAWRDGSLGKGYSAEGFDRGTGGADVVRRFFVVAANGTLSLGADDVRAGGASVTLLGTATINLPKASFGACEILVDASTLASVALASASNIQSDTGAYGTNVTLGGATPQRLYQIFSVPGSNIWCVQALADGKVGGTRRLPISLSSGAASLAGSPDAVFSVVTLAGTTLTMPTSGIRGGSSVLFYASADSIIQTGGSVVLTFPGGRTATSMALAAGNWALLNWSVTGITYLVEGPSVFGRVSQEATPTSGSTVTAKKGVIAQTIHLLHASTIASLTVALPASPLDDTSVTLVATSAVTAVTWSGGTVGPLVPTSFTSGQLVTLRYSASSSTWR